MRRMCHGLWTVRFIFSFKILFVALVDACGKFLTWFLVSSLRDTINCLYYAGAELYFVVVMLNLPSIVILVVSRTVWFAWPVVPKIRVRDAVTDLRNAWNSWCIYD